jgi:tetratricopeptide (TPR) repeat protein
MGRKSSYSFLSLIFISFATSVLGHGTYHELIEEVDNELALRPNDSTLLTRRAFIHVEHEDWKTALVDLERALRSGANESDLSYLRGRALASGGLHEAAREELDRYIATHEDAGMARLERARVLGKLGVHEASLNDYRAFLKASTQMEPEFVIEMAEAMAAQGLHDEALSVLASGIKQIGNVPQLVLKALEFELTAGRFDASLERVEAIQKLMPRPEPWMAKRAAILTQAGRPDAAKAAWTALRDHLLALPNLERGSHAMSCLLEEAQQALKPLPQQTITIISKP